MSGHSPADEEGVRRALVDLDAAFAHKDLDGVLDLSTEDVVFIGSGDGEEALVPRPNRATLLSDYDENAAAYWNLPEMEGVYAVRGRAWKASPHLGSGGIRPSSWAGPNPKRL